jgi:PAS domain S-box-containing protein
MAMWLAAVILVTSSAVLVSVQRQRTHIVAELRLMRELMHMRRALLTLDSSLPPSTAANRREDPQFTRSFHYLLQSLEVAESIRLPKAVAESLRRLQGSIRVVAALRHGYDEPLLRAAISTVMKDVDSVEDAIEHDLGGNAAATLRARRYATRAVTGSTFLLLILLIIDRRRAAVALANAMAEETRIIETIPDVIYTVDHDGNFGRWNMNLERVTGLSAEALRRKSILDLYPSEAAQLISRALLDALELGYSEVDCPLVVAGRCIDHHWTIGALRNNRGKLAGLVAAGRDSSSRNRMEEALRRSERDLQRTLDTAHDAIVIASVESRTILYGNECAIEMYGYAPGTAQTINDLLGEDVMEVIVGPALEADGEYVRVETTQKDGRGRPIVVEAHAAFTTFQEERAVIIISRDISDRRRAEEEQQQMQVFLTEVAQEWSETFDAVRSPMVIVDAEGRIRRLNRTARELMGQRWDRILQSNIASLPGEPWRKAAAMARFVLENGIPLDADVRDPETGRLWNVSAYSTVLPGDYNVRVILVAHDVTLVFELQESVRRSEVMSTLGALVVGIAHEVRNPLFSISATLDAFEARFGSNQDQVLYLSRLRTEIRRLSRLMQDLLEFGKPRPVRLEPGSLVSVIWEAAGHCAAAATEAGLDVRVIADAHLPPIAMDRERLVQVFQNVIENAIQHTPAGGIVEVETSTGEHDGARWVVCEVRDTGPGFQPEDLPLTFRPFFTRRKLGTGLGLSIVKRIADEHGGRVMASNGPDGGGRVAVSLPAHASDTGEASPYADQN